MNKTKKNHINPQSLLKFWCNTNGRLVGFNKKSKKILPKLLPSSACFKKHFLPQQWEDAFAQGPDAQIKDVVNNIITSGTVSEGDKYFLSRFFVMQKGARDPFHRKIIENMTNKLMPHLPPDQQEWCNLNAIAMSMKKSAPSLIKYYLGMRWKLLSFDIPCLITNEAITTLENVHELDHNDKTIYFPITPQHCISLYTMEKYDYSQPSAKYINDLIARIPETNWIIFNDKFDPMPDIKLFENGVQIWP
jgi:hypothetical protein